MSKILVVDDNKDFAQLLETLLGSNGYDTVLKYDGEEAIKHLKDGNIYDLIITDIIMPGSDGFDVIAFVKEYTQSKVIAISGGGVFLNSQSTVEAITDQVDASLKKPVDVNSLLECVQKVLG